MNLAEIMTCIADGRVNLPESAFSTIDGKVAADGKIPLPLAAISSSYSVRDDIEVFTSSGQFLGMLVLCASRGDEPGVTTLTAWQYAAYLVDAEVAEVGLARRFRRDYFVVEAADYRDYVADGLQSSPLWGGFVHAAAAGVPAPHQVVISRLNVVNGLHYPTSQHIENAERAYMQTYAPERFLKLYHLLELSLDYDAVMEIRNLGSDLNGVGRVFSQYHSGDLPRLKRLLISRCNNIAEIESAMNNYVNWIPLCRTIFDDYSKEGDPLKGGGFQALVDNGTFSLANASKIKLPSNPNQYRLKLLEIAAYWIFRVRCCVAHNRIGEYVLSIADEQYIVEFAEPLVRAVVMDALKRPAVALPQPLPVGPNSIVTSQSMPKSFWKAWVLKQVSRLIGA